MRVTKTVQVEEEGYRLTAHFVLLVDGWKSSDVTSNGSTVPVSLVKELMIHLDEELKR